MFMNVLERHLGCDAVAADTVLHDGRAQGFVIKNCQALNRWAIVTERRNTDIYFRAFHIINWVLNAR